MKITYHHQDNTPVWDEETAIVSGTQYMIDRLMNIWEHHRRPVRLTFTGPDAYPSLWTREGAFAAGLVAGYYPMSDDAEWLQLPEGSIG